MFDEVAEHEVAESEIAECDCCLTKLLILLCVSF